MVRQVAYRLKIADLCRSPGCCTSQSRGCIKTYFSLDKDNFKECITEDMPEDMLENDAPKTLEELIDIFEANPSCRDGTCDISVRQITLDKDWNYANKRDLSSLKNKPFIIFTEYV